MTPADANLIALIMAVISIAFMAPAAGYAFRLRNMITKALLIMAVSKTLYVHLFLVMTFGSAIAVAHFSAHLVMISPVPLIVEFAIHMTIDSMLILVSFSLYLTFRKAYAMMEKGTAPQELERKLRESALGVARSDTNRTMGSKHERGSLE